MPCLNKCLPKSYQTRIHLRKLTYTSPTLVIFLESSPNNLRTNRRSILTKLTYGRGPSSQELPNQLILQTGHRNAAAKNCTLNSKCNKCCNWTCCSDSANFTKPCTNQAWCSFPDKPHSKLVYFNNPPFKNLQNSSQRLKDLDPGTTQPEGNSTYLNNPLKCLN